MDAVAPLAMFVPLAGAAVLAGLTGIVHRVVADLYVLVVTIATTVLCAVLLRRTTDHRVLHWFGGWRPAHGNAIGVALTVDTIGAATALLIGVLALAAFIFSWRHLESGSRHFHVLMLLFEGGMIGFALTGDLFLLFVCFELMSVAAYALTGLKMTDAGSMQGAINFAVVNSAGSFALLLGIGLVYARTGSLNFALIGQTLAGHPADGTVAVALVLLVTGLLTKAAIVPFHFWLADAHAVAPTPACVLFSGIMVELGLYGTARIYWTMFSGALVPRQHAFGLVLLGLGAATIVVGGMMCFLQHNLKRLLAFSTISHAGVILVGLGLMNHDALAGAAVYVVGHGLIKGALFVMAGIVLHRTGALDELSLRGRGRAKRMWPSSALFIVSGLALAGAPPFALGLGKSMIDDAGAGYWWLPWLLAFSGVVTGGAVLRASGRIFGGWGSDEGIRYPADTYAELHEEHETDAAHERTPLVLIFPAFALLALSLVVGLWHGLADHVEIAAARFVDRPAYAAAVLTGHDHLISVSTKAPAVSATFIGIAEAAAAIALALVSLACQPVTARWRSKRVDAYAPMAVLRDLHSGRAPDYVAWFTLGLAVFGGLTYVAVH
ncbi:MAG TPA: complex I subunit 5 family protein [Acidimicrobiia bacterium]|jgi:multicomponent Na+:H+ antiporter subunit D